MSNIIQRHHILPSNEYLVFQVRNYLGVKAQMHIAKRGTVLQTKCCFANSSESARQHQASNCLSRPASVPAWQLLNTNAQTSCKTWTGHMEILTPTVKLSVCRTVHQSHSEASILAVNWKICPMAAN